MRKLNLLCALLTSLLVAAPAQAVLIDINSITVIGTLCNRCVSYPPDTFPPSNTIDGDRSTFWHGENDLRIGEVNELVYTFDQHYQLTSISLFNDFTNNYNMGELAFQYWMGGLWVAFHNVDGNFGRGDFEVLPDVLAAIEPVDAIRLEMTYQGRGAHGGTPAFYLSEIFFFGDPVTVPEPGTIVLMVLGLAGFAVVRWTRRGWRSSAASPDRRHSWGAIRVGALCVLRLCWCNFGTPHATSSRIAPRRNLRLSAASD